MEANNEVQDGVPAAKGDSVNQSTDDQTVIKEQNKSEVVIKAADHERALNDMHKFKTAYREAEEKLKVLETQKAEESQEWEALYRKRDTEYKNLESNLKEIGRMRKTEAQLNAVREKARAHGIIEEDLLTTIPDLDAKLRTEVTDSGRVIVDGADTFVEQLKLQKSHWFQSTKKINVNSGGGGAPPEPKKLTANDVNLAERQYKAGRIPKAKYIELYNQYTKQRG